MDYSLQDSSTEIIAILQKLANELKLDLESVPLGEFIPLPPQAEQRHRLFGKFGDLSVYIFDLYSIALSKIARGFESDLEDVLFLLHQGLIDWGNLSVYFEAILPHAQHADIDSREFQEYFQTLKKMAGK